MKILALDTSTEHCSIALSLNGEMISKEVLAGQQHSKLLLPMLHEMLTTNNLALSEFDGIAFGAGPGSFTGLRIACGIAQGLAFAAELSIVGISTLEALAQRTDGNNVITALDARMGEIYHAAYTRTADGWKTISKPIVCLPQNAPTLTGENWVGSGSGFDIYRQELSLRYHHQLIDTQHDLYPHASEIAQLALTKFTNESDSQLMNAAPIYIRNNVALKENER